MNISPLNGRVILEKIEYQEKQTSLVIIPEAENKPIVYGRILATSKGKLSASGIISPTQVKAGNIVIIGRYAGTEIGNGHIIVNEDDILGVVNDK